MTKRSFGVIVGRFQVHELHEGHKELFRQVKARHNSVIVFVGVAPTRGTKRNPLDFETRRKMINKLYPDFTVLPLDDTMTDQHWSRNLDKAISSVADWNTEVILYGGRDSFAPHYCGKHKIQELALDPTLMRVKGEDIRAKLTDTVMESADFRAGQIYAAMNRPRRVVTTVDIVIYHKGQPTGHHSSSAGTSAEYDDMELLLGRKDGEPGWRFIGGHAETTIPTFEEDAKAEAFQETSGLEIVNLKYIGSCIVPDWRYAEEEDKIKTLIFAGEALTLGAQGADDIAEVKWFHAKNLEEYLFIDTHKPLYKVVKRYFEDEFNTRFKDHAATVEA